jgi:iron complex outermembrane receptor protein
VAGRLRPLGVLARVAASALPCVTLALAMVTASARADATGDELPADLSDLGLEALMDIEVTSVSKRVERRSAAPAAVFVITADDIRHWGVTTIPDALRMVPGLHVARIDANKWAVSARGFSSRFANKLLVMIDGRSVYTPLFAGVYWDVQDVPLEDVDRIEVIRGPGGTLWGANAVNGVINIITRSARETQGGLVALTAGTEDRGIATARYGGAIGEDAHYRVYAKYSDRDEGYAAGGAHDDWRLGQAGFRLDWARDRTETLTLQGDAYSGRSGQLVGIPGKGGAPVAMVVDDALLSGGNVLMRWGRELGDGRGFTLQAYVDHVGRDGAILYEDRNTLDIDFQAHQDWASGARLLGGLGYRRVSDDTRGNAVFSLDPSSRSVDLYSAFLQLETPLISDELTLIIGSKFEHNDFTGFEVQPNLRLLWQPHERHTLWGSIARAVRTPARGEHDVRLRLPPQQAPFDVPWVLLGDDDFRSEKLIAYEAGWRWAATPTLNLDLAVFYNDYDSLRTVDVGASPPPIVGLSFRNGMKGDAYGVELSANWQPLPSWRLQAAYSFLHMDLERSDGGTDAAVEAEESAYPRHQASLWSYVDLGHNVRWDTGLRAVDEVRNAAGTVDGYVVLDTRLAWRPAPKVEVALVGRNLLDAAHLEFFPDFIVTQPTEVQRSVHVSLEWRY